MPKMAEQEHHQSNDFAKKNVTLSRIVEISPSVFDSLEVEINQQTWDVFHQNEITFSQIVLRL